MRANPAASADGLLMMIACEPQKAALGSVLRGLDVRQGRVMIA